MNDGYSTEERHLSAKLRKDVSFQGTHAECVMTDDGWICGRNCSVKDMPTLTTYRTTVDDLIGFEQRAQRRWLRVHWDILRIGKETTFINGRARQHLARETRYVADTGRTWTKRGARRQMKQILAEKAPA